MGSIWFCLVAILLTAYAVLDGFDLGVGVLHLWLARTDGERRVLLRAIGPVWNGNEAWLVAAGGTLYFAFPVLYAASFSGFYLPLMIVLWLLVGRGISFEFRDRIEHSLWSVLSDTGFALASALLVFFFGVALGNVVRGVPFDAAGNFFEPLWTNFVPVGRTGILDWYTILVGVMVLAALTLHGAAWLGLKTTGELHRRAAVCISRLWWAVAGLTTAVTLITFRLLPQLLIGFRARPWGAVFPVIAIAGIFGIKWFARLRRDSAVFDASCAYLTGMLASVAFSLYPAVLPSSVSAHPGLTIANAKAADHGLRVGLVWWPIGILLAAIYTAVAYRRFAGRISDSAEQNSEGY